MTTVAVVVAMIVADVVAVTVVVATTVAVVASLLAVSATGMWWIDPVSAIAIALVLGGVGAAFTTGLGSNAVNVGK